jgi:hypothetical protein
MRSSIRGTRTSEAEVTNVDKFGVWLLVRGKEYFLPHEEYPWFRDATIDNILNVQLLHVDHLHWPKLDVDLSVESLEKPEDFPLVYQACAIVPRRRG